jgi:hypothetical protein
MHYQKENERFAILFHGYKSTPFTDFSGGALLLLIAAWVPVTKLFRRIFSSPASYTMWLVIFLVFFALSAIAEQVKVISFVGFMGNALGALCFKACGSKRMGGENEK